MLQQYNIDIHCSLAGLWTNKSYEDVILGSGKLWSTFTDILYKKHLID